LLRLVLLFAGLIIFIVNQYFYEIPEQTQVVVLLLGIILLGIPHGGADHLIAAKNSRDQYGRFSNGRFNLMYLGNIALFSGLLFFFPLAGVILFLILSAYHFGETDLQEFDTGTVAGKVFIFTYGLLILGTILLPDFHEVKRSIASLDPNATHGDIVKFITIYNAEILSIILVFFVFNGIVFFLNHKSLFKSNWLKLTSLIVLIVLLYKLPLTLSFTFYFVLWHSIFSLKNIVTYLFHNKSVKRGMVIKEVGRNSAIAVLGVVIFGWAGIAFFDNRNILLYAVFGLAALTASHMQVMHHMYHHLHARNAVRDNKPS
jgi:Brp/Blh family beta-carotene 15,15'-monooxygenase